MITRSGMGKQMRPGLGSGRPKPPPKPPKGGKK